MKEGTKGYEIPIGHEPESGENLPGPINTSETPSGSPPEAPNSVYPNVADQPPQVEHQSVAETSEAPTVASGEFKAEAANQLLGPDQISEFEDQSIERIGGESED